MALASIIGDYAADKDATASDILADLQSLLARVNSVTNEQIDSGAVTQGKMASLSVGLAQLIDGTLAISAAGRAKMADGYVTRAKLADDAKISYIRINGEEGSGVHGGTNTAGVWSTRTLNSVADNQDSLSISLSASLITLPAGTYACQATAVASGVNAHKIRLRNATSGLTLIHGTNAWTATASVDTYSTCRGLFTVAASQQIGIDHWTGAAVTSTGLGHATSATGSVEVYAVAEFWKLTE